MNRVELSGRLTRDPELKYVGARDFPVTSLNVAVDDAEGRWNAESKKSEIGSGFYRVDVVGEYGRMIAESLSKGDQVYVVGSLNQYSVGGQDGKEKQTRTQVKATMVVPLTGAAVTGAAIPPPAQAQYDFDDEAPF